MACNFFKNKFYVVCVCSLNAFLDNMASVLVVNNSSNRTSQLLNQSIELAIWNHIEQFLKNSARIGVQWKIENLSFYFNDDLIDSFDKIVFN